MTESKLDQKTQKLLHSTASNIDALLNHAHAFEGLDIAPAEFSEAKFKATAKDLASAIDKEITYMIIACKPPARATDIETMCPKINAGFFQLVQQLCRVPKCAGREYLKAVRKAICWTMVSAVDLLNSFIDDKVLIANAVFADLKYMQRAGVYWEHCKAISQIPEDNRAAVALTWSLQVGDLVKDAAEELCELLKSAEDKSGVSDSNNPADDSSSDESMDDFGDDLPAERLEEGKRIEKLVQIAKVSCNKVGLRCIRDCKTLDEEHVVWLDRLVDLGKPVARAVDDLIVALQVEESEGSWRDCTRQEVEKLQHAIRGLLTLAITFVEDSHLLWFENCRKDLGIFKGMAEEVVR
ncbi:hypothetical protein COEREDRAFT_80816 [Coemansia reversa NRRL 1564]|uniref:Cyclin-D1-binding protein 1-like N-terminal domain-containing protein n=1 Tax=Coemansia reversa (strain ATCC 12441 / NRRL 1564) TaxID=763665 RepID=A0A2G5BDM8_COERN|nr:hypothetical protein COEREDRAFT_80816 [Coemansia reversa NRRL 1564]|eukprot:PIA17111.1 hypothetical protein COEREDRAFT_80816 [Coemansia reversa NRRL 1564]